MIGGRPTKIRITGTISTSMAIGDAIIAPEKPKWPIAATSSGTPTMPPKLAPFSARLIAMPRFLSNQRPERVGDHGEAGAGPAEGEQRIGEIELPGLRTWPIVTAAAAIANDARDQAVARAERLDRLADEGDHHRAEQIEERRAGEISEAGQPCARCNSAT